MEKGPSQTQHWRERGTEPWPHVCLGDADLCLHSFHSLGEVSKTCHSHQIISESYRNIFWLLKKTARLSCLHCYAITFYITVKLNAGRFCKGQRFYKILGKHSTVSQWLLASVFSLNHNPHQHVPHTLKLLDPLHMTFMFFPSRLPLWASELQSLTS